jgi:CRP-like cAMP-binding protein
MPCLCNEIAGPGVEISPTCIGNLWVFENLKSEEMGALVQVARDHGVKGPRGSSIQFPLTHEELGFLVGAHWVSITKTMKAFKESDRILQEGRTIILSQ